MPSKKKKYNARFPAGRIKKIMQTDEEVGKVAQAVPVIISRTLELFVESLLTKSTQITQARNAKTLTPSHMKQCILSESRFDFLKDLVKNIPDASVQEDSENNALYENTEEKETTSSTPPIDTQTENSNTSVITSNPSSSGKITTPSATVSRRTTTPSATITRRTSTPSATVTNAATTANSMSSRTPVIQYVSKTKPVKSEAPKLNFTISSLISKDNDNKSDIQIKVASSPLDKNVPSSSSSSNLPPVMNVPPLIPLSNNTFYSQNTSDSLCIDEDYDN